MRKYLMLWCLVLVLVFSAAGYVKGFPGSILYSDGQDAILYNLTTQEKKNLTEDFDPRVEKPVMAGGILIWLANGEFYIKDFGTQKIQKLEDRIGEKIILPLIEDAKPALSPDGVFLAYEGSLRGHLFEDKEMNKKKLESAVTICIIKDALTDYDEVSGRRQFFFVLQDPSKSAKSPVWFLEHNEDNNLWLGWLGGEDGRVFTTRKFVKKEGEQHYKTLNKIYSLVRPFYKEYGFSVPERAKTFQEFSWSTEGTLYVVSRNMMYKYFDKPKYAFKKFIAGTRPQFITETQLLYLKDQELLFYDAETKATTKILDFPYDWYIYLWNN